MLSGRGMRKLLILLGCLAVEKAHACGCFAPPDPTANVVQAGERIAFAVKDGQITAPIQIKYAGPAPEFGWLLPLPSEPTLELGVDELFGALETATAPHWNLTQLTDGTCLNYGFGGASDLGFVSDGGAGPGGPLVYQDSIGPYDYAVLKADSKDP